MDVALAEPVSKDDLLDAFDNTDWWFEGLGDAPIKTKVALIWPRRGTEFAK